ncbi:unnamed protein product [Periconia digitata]|uniref:Uncharacterized protein n=1 Tax=Periconia digitata TaxID=1303443 RepID=A0A9W4U9V5_9PLEO|nr:unnamed protein product [Periconia digitata]
MVAVQGHDSRRRQCAHPALAFLQTSVTCLLSVYPPHMQSHCVSPKSLLLLRLAGWTKCRSIAGSIVREPSGNVAGGRDRMPFFCNRGVCQNPPSLVRGRHSALGMSFLNLSLTLPCFRIVGMGGVSWGCWCQIKFVMNSFRSQGMVGLRNSWVRGP